MKLTGAKLWNKIDKDLKTPSMKTFKAKLKENFILLNKLLNHSVSCKMY